MFDRIDGIFSSFNYEREGTIMNRRGFLKGVVGATGIMAVPATIDKALGFNEFVEQETSVHPTSLTSDKLKGYFGEVGYANTIAEATEIAESHGIGDRNHGDLWMDTTNNELLMWNGWTQRWVGVKQ